MVNYNPLYVARELRQQIEDSGTTTMVVPDIAAICDKVLGLLPSSDLQRIIVCPFAGVLPPAKRVAFTILKRKMVAHPAWSHAGYPVPPGRRRRGRRRRRWRSTRPTWRCCNIPAARPAARRAPC